MKFAFQHSEDGRLVAGWDYKGKNKSYYLREYPMERWCWTVPWHLSWKSGFLSRTYLVPDIDCYKPTRGGTVQMGVKRTEKGIVVDFTRCSFEDLHSVNFYYPMKKVYKFIKNG